MASEDGWSTVEEESGRSDSKPSNRSGYDPTTGIYHSLLQLDDHHHIPTCPNLDTATFIMSQFPNPNLADTRVALIDSVTNHRLTYAQIRRSVNALAAGLHHALGVRKGDVVLLLSPNSILYPIICLAVLSVGAVLTTTNPLNTTSEITKQVHDSGAKLAISDPEQVHKLIPTRVPTILTTRPKVGDDSSLSIEELVDECEPLDAPLARPPCQSDTAALLYSSGTTGVSKGVILTHANLISIIALLKWYVQVTESDGDVYLGFLPMFHVYGLAFFALGLFSVGATTVVMPRFDFVAMLEAIEVHRVSHIPAVPPVILGLVKNTPRGHYDLSSMRRVGSGAAPLSKEVAEGFRERFPWVQLRQGYGLTESSGATTLFISEADMKAHPGSVGALFPTFCAKVVDVETGKPQPPKRQGELWVRSPTVTKGYFGNEEATVGTFDSEGWLRTGDLCYFDEDGFLYIVDRIKELIKHNGYQVAPAELEAILLNHPNILDAAVIPDEDEEAGQIPVAYVVRKPETDLTEHQIIQFVASQVAPYKKVKKVSFIEAIPRSAAGKILRKELVAQRQQKAISKL
ncbi:probable CoA ligase CCL5 [Magnolia sinica]|uniref:probable CoA ligase CCL5 n=1 Tax=Magnolia sinica TaxID=86752 RepID=UPI00265A7BE7|nr:probable CoA ligase CCL5 [Magnolia sinica]